MIVGRGLDISGQSAVRGSDLFSIKSCQLALIIFKASICNNDYLINSGYFDLLWVLRRIALLRDRRKTALCVKDYQASESYYLLKVFHFFLLVTTAMQQQTGVCGMNFKSWNASPPNIFSSFRNSTLVHKCHAQYLNVVVYLNSYEMTLIKKLRRRWRSSLMGHAL